MTEAQVIVAAHRLKVHTTVVTEGYHHWQTWCEREDVDPELHTFERWLEDMQDLADSIRKSRKEQGQ